jgi:uncharacterized Zn ribbon protein/biotin operon repressor
MRPEQLNIIRQIRKTIMILVAMYILGKPTGETEIGRVLDISGKSAREQLDSLERLGYVVRNGRKTGFTLTEEALCLGIFDHSGKLYRNDSGKVFRNPIIINDSDNNLNCIKSNNLKNSDSITIIKDLTREDHNAQVRYGKKFHSCQVVDKTVDNPVDNSVDNFEKSSSHDTWEGIPHDLVEAFRKARLLPNQRIHRLAQQKHITPTYVRAHYQDLVKRGRGDQTGLLVKILEANTPMPEVNELGHLLGCECQECQSSGEYRGWESSGRRR